VPRPRTGSPQATHRRGAAPSTHGCERPGRRIVGAQNDYEQAQRRRARVGVISTPPSEVPFGQVLCVGDMSPTHEIVVADPVMAMVKDCRGCDGCS
jgi:hypothetical protein